MRVKFGSLVSEGTGKLGGSVVQNSLGGAQMRSKPINKKKPSYAQAVVRGVNKKIHGYWRHLTDEQRASWSNAAGSGRSGANLFYSVAYNWIINNLMPPPIAGIGLKYTPRPNILVNPYFDVSSGWTVLRNWSYGDYSAICSVSTSGNSILYQNNVFVSGARYLFLFNILSTVGGFLHFYDGVQFYNFERSHGYFALEWVCAARGFYLVAPVGVSAVTNFLGAFELD